MENEIQTPKTCLASSLTSFLTAALIQFNVLLLVC